MYTWSKKETSSIPVQMREWNSLDNNFQLCFSSFYLLAFEPKLSNFGIKQNFCQTKLLAMLHVKIWLLD